MTTTRRQFVLLALGALATGAEAQLTPNLAALRKAGRLNEKSHEKRKPDYAWDEAAFQRISGATARSLGYG